MKPSAEMISSLVWVLLGLGICLYSVRLQLWTAAGPGSGLLPFVAGLFIGLFGLALLLLEWARRRRGRRPAPFWADAAGRNRVALVVLSLGAMAYLMPVLGFLLAASLVMTFLLGVAEHARLASSVTLALASSLSIYWLFASLLQVRLPRGVLGF